MELFPFVVKKPFVPQEQTRKLHLTQRRNLVLRQRLGIDDSGELQHSLQKTDSD